MARQEAPRAGPETGPDPFAGRADGVAEVSVSDLANEAAKCYCDAVLVRDWIVALLEHPGVPPIARAGARGRSDGILARVMEEQLMRKMVAFTTLMTPLLEAEVCAWARRFTQADAAAAGDSAQHRILSPLRTVADEALRRDSLRPQ